VPLGESIGRERTIGEVLELLVDNKARGDLQQGVDVPA
jgi:hypothetical protein